MKGYMKGRLFLVAIMLVLMIQFSQTSNVAYISSYSTFFPSTQENAMYWDTIGNPDYLDPHVNYESYGQWISYNVYETLYTYDWDSASTEPTVPLLASGLEISSDGLEYTFTLRQGITFHDDTPFNASCVKYNIQRILAIFDEFGPAWMIAEPILGGQAVLDAVYEYGSGSSEHTSAYYTWAASDAITILGDYVVRIKLAYAYVPFLSVLATSIGSMMSPTWIEDNGGISFGEHNYYVDEHTCGTGPYMVIEWNVDENIILERNADYWRETAAHVQFPYAGEFDTLIFRTNEDVNSRLLNLQAGEADGIFCPTSRAYYFYNNVTGPSGDGTLKSLNPNVKVWTGEKTYSIMTLGLNMHATYERDEETIQNPGAMKDFREALTYLFDYDAYISSVRDGFGVALNGPIPDGMLGFDDEIWYHTYNLTHAQIAWNNAMADGLNDILENGSYEIRFEYNAGNVARQEACLLLKDGLETLLDDPGTLQPYEALTISVMGIEWSTYLSKSRTSDLIINYCDWYPDYADPDNFIVPFAKSTGVYASRIGLDESDGWNEYIIDTMINDASVSFDTSEREGFYSYIQQELSNEFSYIWCMQLTNFHVERAEMNGYVFNPMHEPYFFHMWKDTIAIPTTISPTPPPDHTITTGTTEQGLAWSVLPGDRFDYTLRYYQNGVYREEGYYVIVGALPAIPEEVTSFSQLIPPSAKAYWSNGSEIQGFYSAYFIALPTGNWDLITDLLLAMLNQTGSYIESYEVINSYIYWTYGVETYYGSTNMTGRLELYKADGVLSHYLTENIDAETGELISSIEISRAGYLPEIVFYGTMGILVIAIIGAIVIFIYKRN